MDGGEARIGVVIPCFRVRRSILDVLRQIGPEVSRIYVVDDACPEHSGELVRSSTSDARVAVLQHDANQGVGGATLTGYGQGLEDGMDLLVKLDGDGQMDPALIPDLVTPILTGHADYAKGNRFFRLEGLRSMPTVRLLGNSFLSFLTKFSSGYWNVFDPTNGYTAIHAAVARDLPFEKLSRRFFFESDLLFRLNTLGAVVVDVPMEARYLDESSNLRVTRVGAEFLLKHLRNFAKRLFYNYYLRNFNVASIELMLGLLLLLFGTGIGLHQWIAGALEGRFASSGTVMLAALPIIIGSQLVLGFLNYDLQNLPSVPLHVRTASARRPPR